MNNCIHNLVPVAPFLDNPFDGAVDAQEVLYLPNILGLLDHCVVFRGKLQSLLETGVLRARHQETQTQIGQPGGDALYHGRLNWIPSASSLVLAKSRAL